MNTMVDEYQVFKAHIAFISTKLAKNVGTLLKLKNFSPKRLLECCILLLFIHVCFTELKFGHRRSLAI